MTRRRPHMVLLFVLALGVLAPPWSSSSRAGEVLSGPGTLARVEMRTAPAVDVPQLLTQDEAARAGKDRPDRVGFPWVTDLRPANSGTWSALPGGAQVWRLGVRSTGARWIALGFGAFRLPPGATLRILDPSGRTVRGPYDLRSMRRHGQLWTPPVLGDTVFLELFWPARWRDTPPRLRLGTVVHGYKDAWASSSPGTSETDQTRLSGPCNIDASCAEDPWQPPKRGVVQLLIGGAEFCTGSLVSTTARDCRPYVLTAAHCVGTPSDAASTTVRFNHEHTVCGGNTEPQEQLISGATLLATDAASDFALLALDQDIPEEFDPFFNGWDRSATPAAQARCIHHPSGDVKKISIDDDVLVDGSNWGSDHWRVKDWDLGTTEAGSSGAPLFDAQKRIIGQLHGGSASCDSQTWDEFGKLAVSWSGSGSPGSRLSDWLDPVGTGEVVLDGTAYGSCQPRPELAVAAIQVAEEGNGNGVAEPGERLTLAISLRNDGSAPASAVKGALSATMPDTYVIHGSANWPTVQAQSVESSSAPHFVLDLDRAHACGEPVPLQIAITLAESATPETATLQVPTGSPQVEKRSYDWPDPGSEGLSAGGGFARTESAGPTGGAAWFAADPDHASEAFLQLAAPVPLPAHSRLRFLQQYDTETGWDGGVIELSADGGVSWQDAGPLVTQGGYQGGIDETAGTSLAGRAAWSGLSNGWGQVEIDLSALAGSAVALRWRLASNDSIGGAGWTIDGIVLESTSYSCQPPSRPATRPAGGKHKNAAQAWPVNKKNGGNAR